MSGWERVLVTQSQELEKLRGTVTEYQTTLRAMQSTLGETVQLREELQAAVARAVRLRGALRIVRDRIAGRVGSGAFPGGLLAYLTRVLDETGAWVESETQQP